METMEVEGDFVEEVGHEQKREGCLMWASQVKELDD